ncbi:hypothetical protein [Streptomyces viridochromogenes]
MSVLMCLLALPNHARIALRAPATPSAKGPGRVAAALRELEERRYLRRAGAGGELPVVYEVFDTPYEADPRTGETEKVPEFDAPSRQTVRAAHLLISLRDIDRRLTLNGAEALRLAPLVEKWWERGVSSARVRAALAYDWPGPVISAAAHVEACLVQGCPRRPSSAPVTAVEVEWGRPRVLGWKAAVRWGGALVRGLHRHPHHPHRRAALTRPVESARRMPSSPAAASDGPVSERSAHTAHSVRPGTIRGKVRAMRMLLKANIDTEKSNDLIRSGKMPQVVQEILENVKPEASYFTVDHGQRTMLLFFDMKESSQMPSIAERLFLELDARVDYTPVMNPDDLQKGLSELRLS